MPKLDGQKVADSFVSSATIWAPSGFKKPMADKMLADFAQMNLPAAGSDVGNVIIDIPAHPDAPKDAKAIVLSCHLPPISGSCRPHLLQTLIVVGVITQEGNTTFFRKEDVADTWNLSKDGNKNVIAVIGSEQDIVFAQSLEKGYNDRPVRRGCPGRRGNSKSAEPRSQLSSPAVAGSAAKFTSCATF